MRGRRAPLRGQGRAIIPPGGLVTPMGIRPRLGRLTYANSREGSLSKGRTRMRRRGWTVALLLLALGAAPVFAGSPGPGDEAPEVMPKKWLNSMAPLSWDELNGQLILVEKWATW